MSTNLRYSDLLSDILQKNHSNCICPTEFLENFKKLKTPSNDVCPLGPNCQFGVNNHKLPETRDHNFTECTCFCNCDGPVIQPTKTPKRERSVFIEPIEYFCAPNEVTKLPHYENARCICDDSNCQKRDISTKEYFCAPNEVPKLPHYENARCICDDSNCQKRDIYTNLFPFAFRNKIAMEANKVMTDDMMKKECDEIKMILNDQKFSEILNTKHKKSMVDFSVIKQNKDHENISKLTKSSKEDRKKPKESLESTKTIVSNYSLIQVTPTPNVDKTTHLSIKSEIKLPKKKKKSSKKLKMIKRYPVKAKATCCGYQKSTKKLPHMRYYYSGGTEHYGVKLGHKKCLNKTALVPKNMGWLWNIEDLSKGIRERKGWPPGFIGSNIMQLMSHNKTDTVSGEKLNEHRRRWTSQQTLIPDYKEPKEDPPLLHIIKKGRTYNITFCPKASDDDIGPIPIPLQITEEKQDCETESSNSTLEFEFHSPKPQLKRHVPLEVPVAVEHNNSNKDISTATPAPSPSISQQPKVTENKLKKIKSRGFEENPKSWEEQQTHIQNIK